MESTPIYILDLEYMLRIYKHIMPSARKSIHNSGLNFRPPTNEAKPEYKGTKPTTKQASVKEIFVIMILHICKKPLLLDTNLRVAVYLGTLFLVSLIADVVPIPKGYLSRSDNIFNQYFVKFAWGWNLTVLVPFVLLTSYVNCCGQIHRIVKHHITRLIIATCFWWLWTTLFNIIEANYGKCNIRGEQFNSKKSCLKGGHYWNGFDLSGHCFILVYGSLLIIEEAKSMINWDNINDNIRLEEHYRVSKDTSLSNNPLRLLTPQDFCILKYSYTKYTPYIRGLFILITVFQILWDFMLALTILYYHIMIEKFLGGLVAIVTWYFTYRFWFVLPKLLPKLPGDGLFKYTKSKTVTPVIRKRTNSIINGSQPIFMGKQLRTDVGVTDVKEDLLR